jgi:hypothetical protein
MARFDILPREAVWHFDGLLSCGGNIKKSVDLFSEKYSVLRFKRQ